MKTVKKYQNFYVKFDVLLMSLFNSLKRHGLLLYPTHYLSALPLCSDAFIWRMLNLTLFQILTCLSFLYFRYRKANIEYLKSSDPKQESEHVIYLNAKNLYRYAISKFFSPGTFKQIDPKEFDLNKHISNASKGCVPEVNLDYSKEFKL